METLLERIEDDKLSQAADMLRTAAHPLRLAIIDLLGRHRKLSNTEIQELLETDQATLSQHLTLMKDKGLLKMEKSGRFHYYSLCSRDFLKVISCMEKCCEAM